MLNESFSSVVPFKDQINTFEWVKFFKDFNGLKYKIESQELFLEETLPGVLSLFESLFSKLSLSFQKLDSPLTLVFTKFLSIPQVTEKIFFDLLRQYYLWNTNDSLQQYSRFINTIIADYSTHIRIVSQPQYLLKVIIESLKRDIPFDEVEPLFTTLLEDKLWVTRILESQDPFNFRTVSMNTWLHILRHPSGSKDNLLLFLKYLHSISSQLPFIVTDVPLIDPLGRFVFSLTYLDPNIFSEPNLSVQEPQIADILQYWLTLGSLVLRNINYALLKFTNLSLAGLSHEDIAFYDYLKPKLPQYTESCYNPDLVETFKQYDSPRNRMIFNSIRGHELFTYYRSSILEFHLKKAQQEFKNFPEKKIVRKRVNRRGNKLYDFLNDIIVIYHDFLNEISTLTKASGNYTSFDKIIKKINT